MIFEIASADAACCEPVFEIATHCFAVLAMTGEAISLAMTGEAISIGRIYGW